MEVSQQKDRRVWFNFLNYLYQEPIQVWSEDIFKVFNLLHRYQPESIEQTLIKNCPVIVCIHSTKRGPALGGTRVLDYRNMANAYRDVLKLSSAMTYKAIWARLPLGGGKAVIYAPAEVIDKDFLIEYAEFLNEINVAKTRFITGEDINFGEAFVDEVSKHTPFIGGKSTKEGGLGDPSPVTAMGIYLVIKSLVEETEVYSRGLKEKIVAVQGAGKVASALIEMLLNDEAIVYFSENDGDPDAEKRAEAAEKLGARRVARDEIHRVPAHIFSPCAIGGVINKRTIPLLSLRCRLIVGGANNILDAPEDGIELHRRRILYAPDYVVNRFGLEWVYQENLGVTCQEEARKNLTDVARDLKMIAALSTKKDIPTSEIADRISRMVLMGEVETIEESIEKF